MNYSERIAKCVVETALQGAQMKPILSQPHGEYDFDLHYPDGTIAVVEVTAAANQSQKWIYAKIRSPKEGGSVIEAKECTKSWKIFAMDNADIPSLREQADPYLSRLEQAGEESFRSLDAFNSRLFREAGIEKSLPFPVPQCVEDVCYDLRIERGHTIPTSSSPRIFICPPNGSFAVEPRDATKAGELEAWKEDNRKKLGAAKTDERHLVVYMDAVLPSFALTEFEPPRELPNLPNEITHIWLFGHSGEADTNEFVVWRASTQEPWHSQRVVIPYVGRKAS